MEQTIRLSVRKLVEFILRSGDIDSRYAPGDRMAEGTRLHKVLQESGGGIYENYKREVKLSAELAYQEFLYVLEGRADGVFTVGDRTVVEEIKTTSQPLHTIGIGDNETYWAQAKCYAWMYALQNGLREISVQLTYYNADEGASKRFEQSFRPDELAAFVGGLIEEYAVWTRLSSEWRELRDFTVRELRFPFPDYRRGQREMAAGAYRAISGGRKLFAQAPTGTGKTISALFPAVKALGEGLTSKIFYLTAKTITRRAAEEAVDRMRRGGLLIKTLTLTAKDKICFCDKAVCRPEMCAYAKGYYDRANAAVYDIVTSCDNITREVVESYAMKHTVCPFELSLDVALWADCVICDYNYVFDPRVYLRRFFAEGGGDYVFLVDEAHNLVDRAREMFSAQLTKTQFYEIKKRYKGVSPELDRILGAVNKHMIGFRKRCGEEGYLVTKEKPEELTGLVREFIEACEGLPGGVAPWEDGDFLQLYFDALSFTLVGELFDGRYVAFAEAGYGEVTVKLFCLDPSFLLGEAFKRGGSAVLYSATLTPLEYFREVLGGEPEDRLMALDSPFDSRRLCLMAADRISTKYRFREQSVDKIARFAGSFVSRKTGNYIVYFPSYKYMKDVFTRFTEAFPHIRAVEQGPSMSEEERERFLDVFEEGPAETFVAFCVLGGIFSEGIDLRGSRLIGTAIVSVGLPQLNVRQNIIREYFNGKNGRGFEYAYMYPGMNKVLQAAGRVIRTEDDVGAVLLIDERFGQTDYMDLFPKHWRECRLVRTPESLEAALDAFWAKNSQ